MSVASPALSSLSRRVAPADPALSFPTQTRPHLELRVRDLARSVAFYHCLFKRPPAALAEGVARFNPYNPAVDLVLLQDAEARARDGHLGIQLKATADIKAYVQRLGEQGFVAMLEEAETACCYSVANKAWVDDPDGNLWEIFVVTGVNTSEVRCGPSCACEAGGCN